MFGFAKLRNYNTSGVIELQKIIAKLQNNTPKIAKSAKNLGSWQVITYLCILICYTKYSHLYLSWYVW